jgi:hypothetical protein
MKKMWMFAVVVVAVVFFSGCASVDEDLISDSDLTLEELEIRMNKASDPHGIFAASKSYIMRQEIIEKFFLNDDVIRMVELKFEKPGKMALITYEDNKPGSVFCTDGKNGWVADYGSRKIIRLEKGALNRMQSLASLGQPGAGGFKKVFSRVDVFKCTNDEGEFYRIDCYGSESSYPIRFYLDADTFLTSKVCMKLELDGGKTVDYSNKITSYEIRDGVMVPVATEIIQDGVVQECKVIFYRIDQKFQADEFLPPIF